MSADTDPAATLSRLADDFDRIAAELRALDARALPVGTPDAMRLAAVGALLTGRTVADVFVMLDNEGFWATNLQRALTDIARPVRILCEGREAHAAWLNRPRTRRKR